MLNLIIKGIQMASYGTSIRFDTFKFQHGDGAESFGNSVYRATVNNTIDGNA